MERARERSASIAVLTSIPMVAQLVAARALRDAVFLSEYSASLLPRVMLGAAVLSLVAAVSVAQVMPRTGPRATAMGLSFVNALAFTVEAVLVDISTPVVAVVLYLHVSVFGALIVSAFSSVVNERFDPMFAKTVVSHAGTGGALGGVLGGFLALFLAEAIALDMLLYGLGSVSLLMGVGMWSIGPSTQTHQPEQADDGQSRTRTVFSDRYLRRIAGTVILLGVVGVLVDYAMKAEADLRFDEPQALLSFFTLFYVGTALLTFLVQAAFAKPLLARVGLGRTMAVLPVSVALFAGLGAFSTQLLTATLARGAQTITSSSLFRSGYELLYTPIPPQKKRATKAVIDIACNRVGYGVGSLVILALVAASPEIEIATTWVLIVATVVALAGTWLVNRLQSGYVSALASSLRDGSVVLQTGDVEDATTLHTLAQSASSMDRHELLEGIEQLRQRDDDFESKRRAKILSQFTALSSNDAEQVLGALVDPDLDRSLAPQVLALLGRNFYARPASHALQAMGDSITGVLIDALLSPTSTASVRRRVPGLLRKIGGERAIRGLLEGLGDDVFAVRYRCGHALAEIARHTPERRVDDALVSAAIQRELETDAMERELPTDGPEDVRSEIEVLLEDRRDLALQHVFTLLSLTLDRDAIVLSLRALSSRDTNLRGTALEYLHNVLPEDVRLALWPRLAETAERIARPRVSSPDELLQSMASIMRGPGRSEN